MDPFERKRLITTTELALSIPRRLMIFLLTIHRLTAAVIIAVAMSGFSFDSGRTRRTGFLTQHHETVYRRGIKRSFEWLKYLHERNKAFEQPEYHKFRMLQSLVSKRGRGARA
jgi:hypothetical protein